MANKVDVRIIRSKASLISALVSLLKNRSIEELTISELCEKADVNRNTFYSHYSDINDLFDELKGKYMENFIILMKNNQEEGRSKKESFTSILETIKINRETSSVILHSSDGCQFLKTLFSLSFQQYSSSTDKSYTNYEVAFVNGGISNIIMEWENRGYAETPQVISEKIMEILARFL